MTIFHTCTHEKYLSSRLALGIQLGQLHLIATPSLYVVVEPLTAT